MNHPIDAFGLAALAYDEKGFYDEKELRGHATDILPGTKPHIVISDDGSIFYSLVIDNKTGTGYLVCRGTDAFDTWSKIKAWGENLNVFTGTDGVHNGFQSAGDKIFNRFKKEVDGNCAYLKIQGHSKGAGESLYLGCLAAENLNVRHTEVTVFAAPPAGNQMFETRTNKHLNSGKLTITRYVFPNDPIASKIMRRDNSLFGLLDGVDVGDEIILPNILKYTNRPEFAMLAHSPQLYCSGLIAVEIDGCGQDSCENLRDLRWIQKRLVN